MVLLSCVYSPSCVLSYVVTDVINLSVDVGGRARACIMYVSYATDKYCSFST